MNITIDKIIDEYIAEASFLWLQRSIATHIPNCSPKQFADLDERLEAHIDGLRVAGDDGWKLAEETLENQGPEDFFPAGVLALEATDERFDSLISQASQLPEVLPGLTSAIGWVSAQFLSKRVKSLLADASPIKQKLGIAACAMHRRDPGSILNAFLSAPIDSVRIRTFRAAGELGRKDTLPHLLSALGEVKPEARFWAAWSSVLLGNRDKALDALFSFVFEGGPHQLEALQLALQAVELKKGHALLLNFNGIANSARLKIIGSGIVGNPEYVPGLIEQMRNPELARVAGEAFVFITGADFNLDQLEAMPPDGFEDGPTEDPDDEVVEIPEDIALPWPDVDKMKTWWDKNQMRFQGNARYFLGKPVSRAYCVDVLKTGFQRQRIAAAQHLCLLNPGTMLFPTSAPAWRQKRWLEKW